jgi:hypothetical protein
MNTRKGQSHGLPSGYPQRAGQSAEDMPTIKARSLSFGRAISSLRMCTSGYPRHRWKRSRSRLRNSPSASLPTSSFGQRYRRKRASKRQGALCDPLREPGESVVRRISSCSHNGLNLNTDASSLANGRFAPEAANRPRQISGRLTKSTHSRGIGRR